MKASFRNIKFPLISKKISNSVLSKAEVIFKIFWGKINL